MQIQIITQSELSKVDPVLQSDHPKFLLEKLIKIIDMEGAKTLLRSPIHGNNRDLLIGALFAFYARKISSREWFIQKPEKFPDIELSAFSDRPLADKPLDTVGVEITSIPEKPNTFEEALAILAEGKLSKLYQRDIRPALLVFINNTHAPAWAKQFSEFFQRSNDRFGQVFAIYLLEVNPTDSFVYEVDSLRPTGENYVFKLNEELARKFIAHPMHERFARKIV